MALWVPNYLQAMQPYLANPTGKAAASMYGRWNAADASYKLSNGYGSPGEGGVDLGAPVGTPVYALGDGKITGAGSFPGVVAEVVTVETDVPGIGPQQMYYQHINLDPSITPCKSGQCNQTVKRGQLLGTVSSSGETEIGFNAVWGSIWGTNTDFSKWPTDPRPWIAALMDGTPPVLSTGTGSDSGSGSSGGGSFNALTFLKGLPGGLPGVPVIMGALVIAAIGLGTFLIWKELN